MAKAPSFQFYAGDWLKDPGVRALQLAARGLWIDMLSLMDQSSRRGYLQLPSGDPMTADDLARATGASPDEVDLLLRELRRAGVFSFGDREVIYSRRMVRDTEERNRWRKSKRRQRGVSCDCPADVPPMSRDSPGVSSSSSSPLKSKTPPTPPEEGGGIQPWGSEAEKIRRLLADRGIQAMGSVLAIPGMTAAVVTQAIEATERARLGPGAIVKALTDPETVRQHAEQVKAHEQEQAKADAKAAEKRRAFLTRVRAGGWETTREWQKDQKRLPPRLHWRAFFDEWTKETGRSCPAAWVCVENADWHFQKDLVDWMTARYEVLRTEYEQQEAEKKTPRRRSQA